jgi:hypothetical protein
MLEAGLKDGSVDFYMGPRPQSAMPEGLVVEKPSEIPALSYVVWHIRLDGHDQRMSVSVVASPRFEPINKIGCAADSFDCQFGHVA